MVSPIKGISTAVECPGGTTFQKDGHKIAERPDNVNQTPPISNQLQETSETRAGEPRLARGGPPQFSYRLTAGNFVQTRLMAVR